MTNDSRPVEHCDLVVVGAGIAGLNALFVASRYLTRSQKVVLIDRHPRVGGMWQTTYDYVQLHQPYSVFTAGNIKWRLDADPGHLATKVEVLDHLQYCLDVLTRDLAVETLFGWNMASYTETADGVRVECASSTDGHQRTIMTRRLVNAYGIRVEPNDPLVITSTRVHSVSPDTCDVRTELHGEAPVWVIGGGKTAMDTAHAVITGYPGRSVNLVAGRGTFFGDRAKFFPPGARRWWSGTPITEAATFAARHFDGDNATTVAGWYRKAYGIQCTPTATSFLMGLLSESEKKTIEDGLDGVFMTYFDDAIDVGDSTELHTRDGSTLRTPADSWIVNCSGYVTAHDQDYEPYVSTGGKVLSIQNRSATMHLSSFAGYFMTHLFFLDELRDAPLYQADLQELLKNHKETAPYATFALVQYNSGVIANLLPRKVFFDCRLDFDRWYPLPRWLAAKARFMWATRSSERDRHRRTLDTVQEKTGITCGLLPSVAERIGAAQPRKPL